MKTKHLRSILLFLVAAFALIFFLFPFYLVLINSGKTSGDIIVSTLAWPNGIGQLITNITNVTNNPNFSYVSSFTNSLIITVVSLFLITFCASMAAWVLSRTKTKWSTFIFMTFVASMIVPFQVVMLPLLSVYRQIQAVTGITMFASYFGIIFAYLGFGGSMSLFILHGFIKGIPYSLEEAAMLDGCSPERVFMTIIIPLLKPVQITVIILNGIWIWNDFLLPSLLLGLSGKLKTLPLSVMSFIGSYVKQWDLILTAALLAMIPVIILFIIAQKQIIKGVIDGAVK